MAEGGHEPFSAAFFMVSDTVLKLGRCLTPVSFLAQNPCGSQPQPAIDDEGDAVHERRGVRTEIQGRIRDVVDGPHPAEWIQSLRALARPLVREAAHAL